MRIHSTILLSILAFVVAGLSPPARAQPASAAAGPSADDLFDQAQTAFKAGDLQRAYEAYLAAWRIQKSYDIAGNLGNIEMKLGKIHDAATHLSYAIRSFPEAGSAEQRSRLVMRLEEARAQVGTVHVVVDRPNATITLDGETLGVSPLDGDVFVPLGAHVIEAKLWGHKDAREKVMATRGSEHTVRLTLIAEVEPQPGDAENRVFAVSEKDGESKPPEPPPSAGPDVWLIGGFALSGAAIVTGVVFLAVSASLESDADEFRMVAGRSGCFHPKGKNVDTCDELASNISAHNATGDIGAGALVLGLSGASTTLLYYLLFRDESAPPAPPVAALCGASGCGLVVRSSW